MLSILMIGACFSCRLPRKRIFPSSRTRARWNLPPCSKVVCCFPDIDQCICCVELCFFVGTSNVFSKHFKEVQAFLEKKQDRFINVHLGLARMHASFLILCLFSGLNSPRQPRVFRSLLFDPCKLQACRLEENGSNKRKALNWLLIYCAGCARTSPNLRARGVRCALSMEILVPFLLADVLCFSTFVFVRRRWCQRRRFESVWWLPSSTTWSIICHGKEKKWSVCRVHL